MLSKETNNKRARKILTVLQKKEICIFSDQNPAKSQNEIAIHFSTVFECDVKRRTVGDIIADKKRWLSSDAINNLPAAKYARKAKHANLETVLFNWFAAIRSQNIPVTEVILTEKAKAIGAQLGITEFSYSSGWLQKFKSRFGISNKVISGESAGINPVLINEGRLLAKQKITQYPLCDVYNLDETGLFYKILPDRSLTTSNFSAGVKKA